MCEPRQLDPQRVGDRLDRVLGGAVGRRVGHHHFAADRGDEHDPPLRPAQRRQQGARERHRAEDVDLELAAQLVAGEDLHRAAGADPGVVDERIQASARRRACTSALAASICCSLVTSSSSGSIRPLRAPRPPAARRPAAARTPASTFQPARDRRSALARPIPLEAPVIRTVGTRRRYPKRRPPAHPRATVCGVVASARTGVTLVAIAGMLAALSACGSSGSRTPPPAPRRRPLFRPRC